MDLKCAKATFSKGKLTTWQDVQLDINTTIKDLEPGEAYKYLGMDEGDGIQHSKMKEKIRKECLKRIRSIMKTELNAKNIIIAINTLALPIVTYSFNIINWNLNEIKRLDAKIRKQLTINRMHHPKADVDRLYIPRQKGGRGLIQLELSYKTSTIELSYKTSTIELSYKTSTIELSYKTSTIELDKYLKKTNDWMLKLVSQHENSKKSHSITKESLKFTQELNFVLDSHLPAPNENACKAREMSKIKGLKQIENRWQSKPLHGQYAARL